MAETIVLDPSAITASRASLDITSYVKAEPGVDWGDAAIQAYMAEQQIGSSPVDYRLPNRTVKIPLNLRAVGSTSFATIRLQLQQKIALFQREGGSIMRQVGSTPLYADVMNATLTLGGDIYQAYRGFDVNAVVTIECQPDWYGTEVVLDTLTGTGVLNSKLKLSAADAAITGNHPGRVRVIVSDTSGHDQHGLAWGFRSRYYDSAATAQLFYEAEALTPVNAAASTTLTGASGGSVVQLTSPPLSTWATMLTTQIASGGAQMSHQGCYRVWCRAYVPTGGPSGNVFVRLLWGGGSLSVPVTNDTAQVPAAGSFFLLDLGTIRIAPPSVGANEWFGAVQGYSVAGASVAIDCLYFQPLDETSGKLTYTSVAPASSLGVGSAPSAGATDAANSGTVAWSNPTSVYAHDGALASAAVSNATTQVLKATGFGFNIPSTATIRGVQAAAYFNFSNGAAPTQLFMWIVKAGTVQLGTFATQGLAAYDYPALNPNGRVNWYGGPTELWATTLTPTDLNNSGFGAGFAFTSTGSQQLNVDYIGMAVWYTLASGFTIVQDAVVYASQTAEIRTDGLVRSDSTGVYGPISQNTGDLPRIPPSGLENRPVELFVKPSRGELSMEADSNLDSFSVVVRYRPSFLYVGE